MGNPGLPPDHPLAGYDGDLDDHAAHLEALAEAFADAAPDDYHAFMLVTVGADGTDTVPSVREGTDPRWASLWMLGAHIRHVAAAATAASGKEMALEEAALDAIGAIREHEGPSEVYE